MKERFISSIQEFKKANNIKSLRKQLISQDRYKVLKSLLGFKPEILDYLNRDFKEVSFDNKGNFLKQPVDFQFKKTDKNKKKASDYHEALIFATDDKSNFKYKSFQEFYNNGSYSEWFKAGYEELRKDNTDLHITDPMDVYQIRNYLNSLEYNGEKKGENFRFVLSFNSKDSHATMMLTVVDKNTKKPLTTIFINSDNKPGTKEESSYYDYIQRRFNMRNYYRTNVETGSINYPNNTKIMPKEEMDKLSNEQYWKLFEDYDVVVARSNKVDEITINTQIPFINASHNLQLEKDDQNCVIYADNFIRAIHSLLGDKQKADEIYGLAEKIASKDKDAEKKIQDIFQSDLKEKLPMYYDGKSEKTKQQIKQYHLEYRWNKSKLAKEDVAKIDDKPAANVLKSENTISESSFIGIGIITFLVSFTIALIVLGNLVGFGVIGMPVIAIYAIGILVAAACTLAAYVVDKFINSPKDVKSQSAKQVDIEKAEVASGLGEFRGRVSNLHKNEGISLV